MLIWLVLNDWSSQFQGSRFKIIANNKQLIFPLSLLLFLSFFWHYASFYFKTNYSDMKTFFRDKIFQYFLDQFSETDAEIFSETNFPETDTETFYLRPNFRNRILKNWQKSWNREVSKLKCHTLMSVHTKKKRITCVRGFISLLQYGQNSSRLKIFGDGNIKKTNFWANLFHTLIIGYSFPHDCELSYILTYGGML